MTVAHILQNKGGEIVTCSPQTPISEVASMLAEKRIGAVLVRQDDKVAGMLSERDIVRSLGTHGAATLDLTAADLMTAAVITCSPGDTASKILSIMSKRRFRHLPVVDEGELIGLISIGDVVQHRINEAVKEAEALKEYIATG